MVRTKAVELVDDGGKVRAQLNVESNGEVVFRLRDPQGTIRAKFGADERGAGLLSMDDRTEATVQIRSGKNGGDISLFGRDGKKREIIR